MHEIILIQRIVNYGELQLTRN
jgi:hypothetical protein